MGCYADLVGGVRNLNGSSIYPFANMTNQWCAIYCNNNGYTYFGLQFGLEKNFICFSRTMLLFVCLFYYLIY